MRLSKTFTTFFIGALIASFAIGMPSPQEPGGVDPLESPPDENDPSDPPLNITAAPRQNATQPNLTAPDDAFSNATGNGSLPIAILTDEEKESQNKFEAFLQASLNCSSVETDRKMNEPPTAETKDIQVLAGEYWAINNHQKAFLDDIPPMCLVAIVVEKDKGARDDDTRKVAVVLNTPYSEFDGGVVAWEGFENEIKNSAFKDAEAVVRVPKADWIKDENRKYAENSVKFVEQKLMDLVGKQPQMKTDAKDTDGDFKIEDGDLEIDGDDVEL